MHTSLARDATTAHLNSDLPHLVLHYDPCTGKISALSTEPSSPSCCSDSEDEAMRESEPQPLRRHANIQQTIGRPSIDAGATEMPSPKRQNSKFGSMVRKLIARKSEKQHISLPINVFTPPLPQNYPGGYRPGKLSHGSRPASTPERQDLPQSPLAAHPMAIAGSGDAVARITQFVNQKGELPRGSSLPNFIFSAPAAGQTWYQGRELSQVSEQNEPSGSNASSQRSLASSRHRSRSVSALSDSTKPASERHVLRKQQSSRSLRRSKSSSRRHNTTPDVPEISSVYQSGSSEDTAEPRVNELPADVPNVPDVPHSLPQLQPVPHPQAAETEQSAAPRQTFDFSSLATAMRSQDEVNLETHEERLIAMEVKMMNLEYAISKVQGRLPSERPVSYRKPSTETKLASEGAYTPPHPEHVLRREQSPSPRIPEEALHTDEIERSRSTASTTSTVRPSRPAPPPPSQRLPPPPPSELDDTTDPEIFVDITTATFPRRSSITLLTVDHYSKLVSLLRHEQAARKQLAEEVTQLQAEVTALRPLAHSPLGSSYRSWRDAKSQTIEKGWAVIEEFRAGKPMGRSGSAGGDQDNEAASPRRSAEQLPSSPVASDASSDVSFGNAYETPAEVRGFEENLFYPGIPAGQAF